MWTPEAAGLGWRHCAGARVPRQLVLKNLRSGGRGGRRVAPCCTRTIGALATTTEEKQLKLLDREIADWHNRQLKAPLLTLADVLTRAPATQPGAVTPRVEVANPHTSERLF